MCMKKRSADILVTNGTILTMEESERQIINGAIAIDGDRIAAVGSSNEFADWKISKVIDAARAREAIA